MCIVIYRFWIHSIASEQNTGSGSKSHLGGLKDPSTRIPQVHRQIQFSHQVTCYMWTSLNGLKYSRDNAGAETETEISVDQLCTSD